MFYVRLNTEKSQVGWLRLFCPRLRCCVGWWSECCNLFRWYENTAWIVTLANCLFATVSKSNYHWSTCESLCRFYGKKPAMCFKILPSCTLRNTKLSRKLLDSLQKGIACILPAHSTLQQHSLFRINLLGRIVAISTCNLFLEENGLEAGYKYVQFSNVSLPCDSFYMPSTEDFLEVFDHR